MDNQNFIDTIFEKSNKLDKEASVAGYVGGGAIAGAGIGALLARNKNKQIDETDPEASQKKKDTYMKYIGGGALAGAGAGTAAGFAYPMLQKHKLNSIVKDREQKYKQGRIGEHESIKRNMNVFGKLMMKSKRGVTKGTGKEYDKIKDYVKTIKPFSSHKHIKEVSKYIKSI